MNLGGFSWKRLLGISTAKSKISRMNGVPFTRSGRQRKLGAAMGCTTMLVIVFIPLIAVLHWL